MVVAVNFFFGFKETVVQEMGVDVVWWAHCLFLLRLNDDIYIIGPIVIMQRYHIFLPTLTTSLITANPHPSKA